MRKIETAIAKRLTYLLNTIDGRKSWNKIATTFCCMIDEGKLNQGASIKRNSCVLNDHWRYVVDSIENQRKKQTTNNNNNKNNTTFINHSYILYHLFSYSKFARVSFSSFRLLLIQCAICGYWYREENMLTVYVYVCVCNTRFKIIILRVFIGNQ